MTHLIELKDVYKIYPMGDETVHALDGVSLSIDQEMCIRDSSKPRVVHPDASGLFCPRKRPAPPFSP